MFVYASYIHCTMSGDNPLSGAHLDTQQLLNTHQSMSVYQLHAFYTSPVKTIITSKFTPYFQWSSVVPKENRLQTKIRCAIIADLVLQISTNGLPFLASYM